MAVDWAVVRSTLALFLVAGSWVKFTEWLGARVSIELSRKALHIGIGLLYLGCWLAFYSPACSSCRYWASLVPLAVTLKIALVGAGWLRDEAMVRSMSRSSRSGELLRGPLHYGLIFIANTWLFWGYRPHAILSLILLCVGDGMAALVPTWVRAQHRVRLPYNRNKSLVGLVAFVLSATVVGAAYLEAFERLDWFERSRWHASGPFDVYRVGVVALGAGLVESATSSEYDNLLVFGVGLVLSELVYG